MSRLTFRVSSLEPSDTPVNYTEAGFVGKPPPDGGLGEV